MRTAPLGFAIGAILSLAAGCGSPPSPPADDAPAAPVTGLALPDGATLLAKVGDGGVTAEEFARAAAARPPANGQAHTPEERRAILDELVAEEVLFQEAARKGLHRDPKIRRVLINLLLREDVYSQVDSNDFTDEQLRAYFEAHRAEFVIPERIQLWRIFLRTGDQRSEAEAMALAHDLRARIEADPGSFADLALQYSEDPYQRRGGDVGFVTAEGRPGIDPMVISTAFQLPERVVSQPFVAGGGVNIVYVPQRRERVERGFDQMKGAVLRRLKNDRYEELTSGYVQKVRARYPVQVDEGALERIPITPGRAPVRIPLGADGSDPDAGPDHGHEDELH